MVYNSLGTLSLQAGFKDEFYPMSSYQMLSDSIAERKVEKTKDDLHASNGEVRDRIADTFFWQLIEVV